MIPAQHNLDDSITFLNPSVGVKQNVMGTKSEKKISSGIKQRAGENGQNFKMDGRANSMAGVDQYRSNVFKGVTLIYTREEYVGL